jgi:hypothetical protein
MRPLIALCGICGLAYLVTAGLSFLPRDWFAYTLATRPRFLGLVGALAIGAVVAALVGFSLLIAPIR